MSAMVIQHRTSWTLIRPRLQNLANVSMTRRASSIGPVKNYRRFNPMEDTPLTYNPADRPLIRSFFYVPGSNKRFLEKSITSDADMVVLDLEDGVAASEKGTARKQIAEHLYELSERKKAELSASEHRSDTQEEGPTKKKEPLIALRINDATSGHVGYDVKEVLLSPGSSMISTLVVPKVKYDTDLFNIVSHIRNAARALGTESWATNLNVIPLIESPEGVTSLRRILTLALSKKCIVPAAVFAAEDFRAAARLPYVEGNWNLDWSRNYFVTTCKIVGIEPLDMVCLDFREEGQNILKTECQKGFEMGFVGKQVIHPSQIPVVNEMFAPTTGQIEFADKVMQAKQEADEKGVGAIEVDGKMIDEPMWKYSRFLLERAVKAGLYSSLEFNRIAGSGPMAGGEPRAWKQSQIKDLFRAAGIQFPREKKPKIASEGGEKNQNEKKEE